jgi:glycosyltransferase involved in cell wall biosynthesis
MIIVNARIAKFKITGVQRYLIELLKYFGDRVHAVSPVEGWERGFRGHLWEQVRLPQLVANNLLFSPNISGPLSVKKQVVTVHDITPIDYPDYLVPEYVLWYRFMIPRLLKGVQRIIAVSNYTKQKIVELIGIEEEKIEVIPNGVDKKYWMTSPDSESNSIRSLGLYSSRYLLYVGSLQPRKNLSRLLQAWGLIQNEVPEDIWLVVAGAEGKKEVFSQLKLSVIPPRVQFTGYVSDDILPIMYRKALGFVFVSLYEGFGLPILEAMASGTPVLASNLTAIPEVAGNAALLVDPYKTEEIADGLLKLIMDDSLRTRLQQKGLEQAKLFSWEKTAEKTWKVLEENI